MEVIVRMRTVIALFTLVVAVLIVILSGITISQAGAASNFDLVSTGDNGARVGGVDFSPLTVTGGSLDFSTGIDRGNAKWKGEMRGYVSGDRLVGSLRTEVRIIAQDGRELYGIDEYEFTSTPIPDSGGTLDIILGTFTSRTNASSSGEEVTREGYSGQRITYKVVASAGPLIPPGAVGRVISSGTTSMVGWPRTGGGLDWWPLREGDALVPGCVILVGGEGDPQASGGRVKIAISATFTYLVEANSRVEVLEEGLRVESGSVEADDRAPIEDYTTYNDNGFCSGKDPGAAQAPFSAQPLSAAGSLVAAAAGDVRYRFEAPPGGTARVAVLTGEAEVKSAITQAKVLLRTGQYVTLTAQGLGPVSEKAFADVPSNYPYRTAIIGMALKGMVNGYKVGDLWEFRPADTVKRAQFAKMIVGTMSLPPKNSTSTRFTDLGIPDADGYPHVFVQAAYDNGITQGTNTAQTTYAPWDSIKRAQVVTMIVRAASRLWPGILKTPPAGWSGVMASFNDVNHGANMRIAEYNGLLAGLQGFDRSWDPYKQATRGEVAQMLWNLMTR